MSVFFAVEPFSPEWIFSLENIIFPLIFTLFCMGIFWFFQKFFKKKSQTPMFSHKNFLEKNPLPTISDPNFSPKIFQIFQSFIAEKYLPKNTLAHTAEDIKKYCHDASLQNFYKKLEIEAFWEPISLDEKEKNLKFLQKILND